MWKFSGTQQGLTLIEVMAVLAVSGLLLVGMWRLYHGSMRAYQRGLQEVRVTLGARTVLRRMTRDVQQALATAIPYGIRGTRPQSPPLADADRLELTAMTHPTAGAGQGSGTPQRIRYTLEPAAVKGTLALKRVSIPVDSDTPERIIPLSERLSGFSVRYFDGQKWYDAWQRETLPQALEITVAFRSSGWLARTHRFTTVVTSN